ncbi:MAG: tetratricopeptide repeat protein [Prevotella sp.]|nr:tetratricopeptide repeat protein [Prevotella sp.]MDY4218611.1 tetratricopeptide repeat protein [Prevotella sp.]
MKQTLKILLFFLFIALQIQAQSDRKNIREGNRLFRKDAYAQAETNYRKAVSNNSHNAIAHYNLGRTLQAEKKDSLALKAYEKAAQNETDKNRKASALYNQGTIFQKQKNLEKAIEAYKNALRNNPKHEKARTNLSRCIQQQQQQNNQQQQQQNKNKNKNNKDQDKKKQQQQNKKNPEQDKNKNKEQENNQRLSKDNAEQLLNAAMQEEKATQERLKKAMRQPARREIEKNW